MAIITSARGERQLWDLARTAPRTRDSWKGKWQWTYKRER